MAKKRMSIVLWTFIVALFMMGIFHVAEAQAGIKLVYQSMVKDAPDEVYQGERFTVTWKLQNQGDVNAIDYRLVESNTSFSDGQTSYPRFTIYVGETGNVSVENFPAPQELGYKKVYFDIETASGVRLNPLALGSLWIEFTVLEAPDPEPDPLSPPTLISPLNGATGQSETPTLDWSSVSNAEAFRVFVSTSSTVLSSLKDGGSCSECIISESAYPASYYNVPSGILEFGEKYYWMVRAWNSDSGSVHSVIWNFTTKSLDDPPTCDNPPCDDPPACDNPPCDDPPACDNPPCDDPPICENPPCDDPPTCDNPPCDDPPPPEPDPCEDDPSPTVHYMDVWQNGAGSAIITVKATDNGSISVKLTFNGQSKTMISAGDDLYKAEVNYEDRGKLSFEATATDDCGNSAQLGPIEVAANWSGEFGAYRFKGDGVCKPGCYGTEADPVNTFNGNFVNHNADATIAGLGGTTIRSNRFYNSMAALWTPASVMRYTGSGDGEMIDGPPLYFGSAWTYVYGTYLLAVDEAPFYEGVQILYPDGHTALFSKSGNTYVPDAPDNFDLITLEGDEYVLRHNSCNCSLESERFNKKGRLVAISDRNGNEITFSYDGDNLKRIENASGRWTEFEYDGDGQIIKASMPENITLQYEYTDGLLTAFINGRGKRTEYLHDGNNQMTDIITPKDHPAIRVKYEPEEWRAVEQIVGENEKHSFEYGDNITTVTDAYGNKRVHQYDDQNRLVQLDHPNGYSEVFDYDDDFNKTYYKDQEGAEWNWTYDGKGNRLTADGPLDWHREWQYNDMNQVIVMKEKMSVNVTRKFTFDYDDKGNLTEFCNPLGDCGSAGYDARGLLTDLYDYEENHTANSYDAEGDLISVTDAEDAVTGFDHDGLGRVIQMKKPLGSVFTYTFDKDSHLTDVNGPLEFHAGFAFDDNGNLTVKTDPNGGLIKYDYNKSDRLEKVVNQLSFSTAGYDYGLMNELTGFTDAEGRSWTYGYDKMLRVDHIKGPLDANFFYDYNGAGRITDTTDANGIITHTDYDALYRPVKVIRNFRPGEVPNSDTNVTVSYEYDLAGNVLNMTDPEKNLYEYEYNLWSKRTLARDAKKYEWTYQYDLMGNLTEVLNPREFITGYVYTDTYRLHKVINPEKHAAEFIYNADGNMTDAVDPRNMVTHYEHDALGRMIRQVRNYLPAKEPNEETNVTAEYEYDLAGNLLFLTNPRDFRAEFRYDAAHRRTHIFDFEKGNTNFSYDRVNNLLTVTDANENATTYEYDDLNRMISVLNAENELKSFGYDLMGNMTRMTEADGTVTLYGHDAVYRLNRVTENYRENVPSDNDTNVLTKYAYDARGLLTQIINANEAMTGFDYNEVGRLVRETDPLSKVWAYDYDGVGNRVYRRDANGDVSEYSFYPDDQLQQILYEDSKTVKYMYDPNNNRTEMQDWLGMTKWSYDPLNRVTYTQDPFDRALQYAYDAAGNRTGMVYPDGNRVGYTYTPNNWMKTVKDAKDFLTQYERDKVGNITHIANPNDTETDLTYDDVYRVLTLVNRQTSGAKKTHSAFEYEYNDVGHVTQAIKKYGWRNPPKITETYDYDGLHRLSGVEIDPLKNNSDKVVMSYAYDRVGNRLNWTSNDDLTTQRPFDGFTRTYAYNPANQLRSVSMDSVMPNGNLTTDFNYDSNGNRVRKLEISRNGPMYGVDYGFDYENRLVEALNYQVVGFSGKDSGDNGDGNEDSPGENGDGKDVGNSGGNEDEIGNDALAGHRIDRDISTLEYDGGGRRMVKTYDPKFNAAKGVKKRIEYVFDGLDPVAEYNMLNGQRDDYYRGAGGRMITMHHFNAGPQGQMYWYHYNHKGDVAGMTKHNGNSHHTYRYDPYGGVVAENGNFTDPHNHYTLTGKEYDEDMGVVWFGARHYDPGVGGWLTQDLYRGRIKVPMSLQRYQYVFNSPITLIDLLGLKVYLGARDLVSSPLGNHAVLYLEPDNPEDFSDEVLNELWTGDKEITFQDFGDDKKGFTLAAFDSVKIEPNNAADLQAIREMYDPEGYKKWYKADYDLQIHEVKHSDMGDTEFIKLLLTKANNYRINEEKNDVGYDLLDRNCSTWTNSMLAVSGFSKEDREKLTEFSGIDWGEEDLLDLELFGSPDDCINDNFRIYPNDPGYVDPNRNIG